MADAAMPTPFRCFRARRLRAMASLILIASLRHVIIFVEHTRAARRAMIGYYAKRSREHHDAVCRAATSALIDITYAMPLRLLLMLPLFSIAFSISFAAISLPLFFLIGFLYYLRRRHHFLSSALFSHHYFTLPAITLRRFTMPRRFAAIFFYLIDADYATLMMLHCAAFAIRR